MSEKTKEPLEQFSVTLYGGMEITVKAKHMNVYLGTLVGKSGSDEIVFSVAPGYWQHFIRLPEPEELKITTDEDEGYRGKKLSGAHAPSGNISGGVDINRDDIPKKLRILGY